MPTRPRPRYALALALFALTFVTMTTVGAAWYTATQLAPRPDLAPWLSPRTVRLVWADPALLRAGLQFSIPALVILLCHELGHFLLCRLYRLPATLPYFLPAPIGLGTFGAFIRIQSPIRTKRELFDVGIGGPIAGFVVLLPILLIGLANSSVVVLDRVAPQNVPPDLIVPGQSLLVTLLATLLHGPIPDGAILALHPFALAAWVGLLATSLNLLPLGQLDGGHIVYAAIGRWQRRLALPIFGVLTLVGFLFWKGWLVWAVISLFIGIRHPRVADEDRPLDPFRVVLTFVALAIFLLCFMPTPARILLAR